VEVGERESLEGIEFKLAILHLAFELSIEELDRSRHGERLPTVNSNTCQKTCTPPPTRTTKRKSAGDADKSESHMSRTNP